MFMLFQFKEMKHEDCTTGDTPIKQYKTFICTIWFINTMTSWCSLFRDYIVI